MSKKAKIIVILGPTSSGKSDVAIRLAKKFSARGGSALGGNGAEIISADSRQIYRDLDLGTGKIPGTWNMKHKTFISNGIPHYLIDIVSPKANYNAAIFKKDADRIIEYIIKRGKLPIICGGTGFWIKSIVDDVVYPEVKPDWKLRSQLQSKPVEELFKMLEKLDSRRAKGIDKKNKVRLIRAIEICKILGKVPKSDKSNLKLVISNLDKKDPNYQLPVTNYQFLQLGIKLSKEKLHKNIKKRLEQRFRAGMIEEVTKLHKQGLSWKKIQSFGLGYYWIPQYLQNKLSYEELFEKVYQAEKDYAKRQMTWFRKDKRIKWVEKFRDIIREVDQFLK